MKVSKRVVIGSVLSVGIVFASSACTSEPDQEFMDVNADHQQVCVKPQPNGELERRPDHECPGQDEGGSGGGSSCAVCWYYIGRAHGSAPAVGSKFRPVSGSYARPSTGTVAKAPASGGFGMSRVSVGG